MINFYDFEVFAHDWLVVIINPATEKETVIHNNRDALIEYYEKHKNEIWCGYNSRNYDSTILKSIILGFDVKSVNDAIIYEGLKSWQIDSRLRGVQLFDYDAIVLNTSLKQLEAFMGNDIRETSVPFDLPRQLTPEELELTIGYCRHDVEQLIEVFIRNKTEFNAQLDLINIFHLSLRSISKSQAQLAAIILKARKKELYDEWEIRLPDTLILEKYKWIAEWFLKAENHNYDKELEVDLNGVPHKFAWGGVHGAIKKYNYVCRPDEMFVMADVSQLYPFLMWRYRLLSRGCPDSAYDILKNTIDMSIKLKKEGKKKEREPYKRFNNIIYGAEGDPTNAMYDPLHRNLVCVFGQVLILDLIEKIESFAELIQSNTDGILVKLKNTDFDRLDDCVYEQRTGLSMTFDAFAKVFQGDVNNYVIVDYDGHMKTKGGYVKSLNDLDNDLPIVNEAIVKYLTAGVEIEDTVNSCNDLKQFQKVVKISGKYKFGYHNGKRLTDRTFRVFASSSYADSLIGKCKDENAKVEKFANTPLHCFIDNGDVNGKACPDKLDKRWYIVLAKKRLRDKFGIEFPGDTLQLEFDLNRNWLKKKKAAPKIKREKVEQDPLDIF